VLLTLIATGCSHLSYYWQAGAGQLALNAARRPISEVLADPNTPAQLKHKLKVAQQIRTYAVSELGLPANKSYALYADVKRPYVTWNVVATPELSMQLKQWCFPVAGCVSYKGYFDQDAAQALAQALRSQGWEAHVSGVPAYSTLGWFDDPLLNTFIHYSEGELARLVFHELAHQLLYVKGDSTFNESFASAVEEFGVDRWMQKHSDAPSRAQYAAFSGYKKDFYALLTATRQELEQAYQTGSDSEKRSRKAAIFAALRKNYETLKHERWKGYSGYDRWFAQPLTNAHLASVGTYTQWLPAFEVLLKREAYDVHKFYAAAQQLAALEASERNAALRILLSSVQIKS
jgi:predicted aminopeptidase